MRVPTHGATKTINEEDDRSKSKAMMTTQSAREAAEVAIGKMIEPLLPMNILR